MLGYNQGLQLHDEFYGTKISFNFAFQIFCCCKLFKAPQLSQKQKVLISPGCVCIINISSGKITVSPNWYKEHKYKAKSFNNPDGDLPDLWDYIFICQMSLHDSWPNISNVIYFRCLRIFVLPLHSHVVIFLTPIKKLRIHKYFMVVISITEARKLLGNPFTSHLIHLGISFTLKWFTRHGNIQMLCFHNAAHVIWRETGCIVLQLSQIGYSILCSRR